MALPKSPPLLGALVLLLVLVVVPGVLAQGPSWDLDFEPEDKQRVPFSSSDFQFTFEGITAQSKYGSLHGETVSERPALATLPKVGAAQALINLAPCALNEPHSHPRATEIGFVTQGEILMGFIEENFNNKTQSGGRILSANVLAPGSFVFPQGLIHFQFNNACAPAQFLASFDHRDPGLQTTALSLFKPSMPLAVLRATTGLNDAQIAYIQDSLSNIHNPTPDPACLKRCAAALAPAPA